MSKVTGGAGWLPERTVRQSGSRKQLFHDQSPHIISIAKVMGYDECTVGIPLLKVFDDSGNISVYVITGIQEVRKYGDQPRTLSEHFFDGILQGRRSNLQEGGVDSVESCAQSWPDRIDQIDDLLIRFLSSAAVGKNNQCIHQFPVM